MDKCKDCYNMDCIFVSETNGCDAVEYCDDFQPMRNADKIRAMSDEELAVLLEGCICPKDPCPDIDRDTPTDKKRCTKCWLEWLRQEVNDGKEEKEENQPAK